MSPVMYDAINPMDLPSGADAYAGYDDGHWPDAAAIAQLFPGKPVVRITVFASDNEGDCLDVETGDATPMEAPPWVVRRRAAGHLWPTVYCSESLWPTVKAAFVSQGVAEPCYWIASYPGPGAVVQPGAVAHQWIDRGGYDESVTIPGWPPTVTPVTPPPPPVIYPGDNVQATSITFAISGGNGWAPSPVPAAKIVNVIPFDENPEVVGHYDQVPVFRGIATQTSKDAPNGALVFSGFANGTFGALVWSVT